MLKEMGGVLYRVWAGPGAVGGADRAQRGRWARGDYRDSDISKPPKWGSGTCCSPQLGTVPAQCLLTQKVL